MGIVRRLTLLTTIVSMAFTPLLTGMSYAANNAVFKTGVVSGTVLSDSGSAVPGVLVSVHGSDGSVVGKSISGSDGSFTFPEITEGDYHLSIKGQKLAFATSNNAKISAMKILVPGEEGAPADEAPGGFAWFLENGVWVLVPIALLAFLIANRSSSDDNDSGSPGTGPTTSP